VNISTKDMTDVAPEEWTERPSTQRGIVGVVRLETFDGTLVFILSRRIQRFPTVNCCCVDVDLVRVEQQLDHSLMAVSCRPQQRGTAGRRRSIDLVPSMCCPSTVLCSCINLGLLLKQPLYYCKMASSRCRLQCCSSTDFHCCCIYIGLLDSRIEQKARVRGY
jgi:hypothetical protein